MFVHDVIVKSESVLITPKSYSFININNKYILPWEIFEHINRLLT